MPVGCRRRRNAADGLHSYVAQFTVVDTRDPCSDLAPWVTRMAEGVDG